MLTLDFPLPRGPRRRQLFPSARSTVPFSRSESCLTARMFAESGSLDSCVGWQRAFRMASFWAWKQESRREGKMAEDSVWGGSTRCSASGDVSTMTAGLGEVSSILGGGRVLFRVARFPALLDVVLGVVMTTSTVRVSRRDLRQGLVSSAPG